MAISTSDRTGAGLRWGGIAGIVFAVTFVVGLLLCTDTPDGKVRTRDPVHHTE